MKSYGHILKSPIITEKTTIAKEAGNVVSFVVDRDANKCEIKKSVETVFKVKVDSVRTVQVAGKRKRSRSVMGKRSNWKKAYVALKAGESIEIFEGV
ncbi:MAG: 50S ribosomal protein L23 [Deltaproteobacteria bacterium]|nr:50S ribosomal protein L23 [Deltaproteobacteria bacterium]